MGKHPPPHLLAASLLELNPLSIPLPSSFGEYRGPDSFQATTRLAGPGEVPSVDELPFSRDFSETLLQVTTLLYV